MDARAAMTAGTMVEAAAETEDDSLFLGLRALVTLAKTGPLDLAELARSNGGRVQRLAAVVAELERGGLVEQLADPALIAVTRHGRALVRGGRWWLN